MSEGLRISFTTGELEALHDELVDIISELEQYEAQMPDMGYTGFWHAHGNLEAVIAKVELYIGDAAQVQQPSVVRRPSQSGA